MPESVWKCVECDSTYRRESDAASCEAAHRNVSTFVIMRAIYKIPPHASFFFQQRSLAQRVPYQLHVKFSDEHGDFGTYKLVHYGFKGL